MRASSIARALRSAKAKRITQYDCKVYIFPAPVRGWNARDSKSAGMKPQDAIILDNYYPTVTDSITRKGSLTHVYGLDGSVDTLMTYSTGTVNQLWAVTSAGSIYNVTSAGAVGAATVSGFTNGRWQYINFTTSAGNYITAVNGSDTPRQYDGTTWSASTMSGSGLTSANLINVSEFKKRLWYIEKESFNVWVLPVDSITGTMTKFNVAAQFKEGGFLMAGGSLTRDGGEGMDDLLVLISSKGEVILYQGFDLMDPTNFVLVGRYRIGAPIGRRCFVKAGADLAAVTIDGVLGISQVITLDRAASTKVALSDRIRNAFNEVAVLHKDKFGWQPFSYPRGAFVFVNIPITESVEQHQYVMNVITGAWCRFTGWNACCWALFNERIYFGDGLGRIILADEGTSDNGVAIVGTIHSSFQYPGRPERISHFKQVKPILVTEPLLSFEVAVITNFAESFDLVALEFDRDTGNSLWDLLTWDIDPWSTSAVSDQWYTYPKEVSSVAYVFRTSTVNNSAKLNAFALLYTPGGI